MTLRSKPVIGRVPSKTAILRPKRKKSSRYFIPMSHFAKKIFWPAEMATVSNEACSATTRKTAMTAQTRMLAVSTG